MSIHDFKVSENIKKNKKNIGFFSIFNAGGVIFSSAWSMNMKSVRE